MHKTTLIFLILFAFAMFSCNKSDDENISDKQDSRIILSLSVPSQGNYPFHVVADPYTGKADIKDSRNIPDFPNSVLVTAKPGYVFLNSKEKLTKYAIDDQNKLKAEGSVVNTGLLGGPISVFLDDKRLLVSTAPRQAKDSLFSYQIINTEDMTEERRGQIHLPVTTGSMASPSSYILKEDKILVPYIHADDQNHAYGKANVAIFNAADMSFEKTISTSKTACLGYSVVSSHAVTENGDLYLISSNANYWGGNESLPSGIVRIKAGQTEFDNDYFLNLTSKLKGNHSGGMIYAGGDKVIVQIFENSLIKAYGDYQQGYVISYYEVDLRTQLLKKLNIPLSKYPRRAMERLKNGKVIIAINAENGENALYTYDGTTGLVRKGMVYSNAEFMSGLIAL